METWADKSSLHAATQSAISTEYTPSTRRESLFLEREPQLESRYRLSGISIYGQDPALSTMRSSALGRASGPIVTQVSGFYRSLYIYLSIFPCSCFSVFGKSSLLIVWLFNYFVIINASIWICYCYDH